MEPNQARFKLIPGMEGKDNKLILTENISSDILSLVTCKYFGRINYVIYFDLHCHHTINNHIKITIADLKQPISS